MTTHIVASFDTYRKAFLSDKENQTLPYDVPGKFGKALAEKHLRVIQTTIRDWLDEVKEQSIHSDNIHYDKIGDDD